MRQIKFLIVSLAIYSAMILGVSAQTTEFSYQGLITDNNAPANGNYDLEFKLFDAATGGTLIGTLQRSNVAVADGVFGVVLDFGAFPPTNRFLEIGVRPPGGSVITTLAPRVKLLSTPYSTQARNAENATNATNAVNAQNAQNSTNSTNATNAQTAQNALQLGGTPASQFVLGNDPRLNDSRNPLPGNANYIQNTTTPQGASNFNIAGNGTAGGTLTGNIVSAATQFNIGIARVLARPGSFNFFAGGLAGASNTTGTGNAFFGENAGVFNTTGGSNTFVGFEAGRNNNIGVNNSYFGKDAGRNNNTGNDNSFFGNDAGNDNTTGGDNSFFGKGSGRGNTTGSDNAFFGSDAGNDNTTGGDNSIFGTNAGRNNQTATGNSFFGSSAGEFSTSGHNTFFGVRTGIANTTGFDNTFVGFEAGTDNTTGINNTILGTDANVGSGGLTNATAIGAEALVTTSNSLVLGGILGINNAAADTNVGIGTTAPLDRLHVNGIIRMDRIGNAGTLDLCRNNNLQISTCSSSLRYKTGIASFNSGLNLVNRLRPITFNWKDGGMHDLGLGAEDVAAVEPLLVTYNDKGEVEGVKYDRIGIVLLNAVKEQQAQIETLTQTNLSLQNQVNKQKETNGLLQSQFDGLKKVVCNSNPGAEICMKKE
jgi:trimeric autotransporter adhesin